MMKYTMKFSTLLLLTLLASKMATSPALADQPSHRQPVANRAPLAETPLVRLPIGSVRPQGWLLRQLELQREGLTGSAEQLYDALEANSGWLGGSGEGWEKSPYYTKGLIALAYTLDDKQLQERSEKWVSWVLSSQRDDGFFGPDSNNDWWPRMVVLYYLRDYYEATGDTRVVPFLTRYFRHQLTNLPNRPLTDWGRARAGDNIEIVLWTYNLTGEAWLLQLADLLAKQAYPWTEIFTDNQFYGRFEEFHPHHIVNVSQALKFSPVVWQLSHHAADRNAYAKGLVHLNRQYGRIDGQISGTEMLSGLSSTDGVELCADVERIVSTAVAARILGDATLGDEIEQVAYNSLPAHVTKDLTGITYYQLQNQVQCMNTPHGFEQDYHNGIMPGPYSGFPCCCYNWHMGWPKLVESLWAATSQGGLATVAYGPSTVEAEVAGGVSVRIVEATEYPFRDTIQLTVEPEQPVKFPLMVRIPAWCSQPKVSVNGEQLAVAVPGQYLTIDREWKANDTVKLELPMPIRTSRWVNNSIGIQRGPLTYGLEFDEQWHRVADHQGPFDEFTVTPGSDWNYALEIDADQPEQSLSVDLAEVGEVPWALESAPVVLKAHARKLSGWGLQQAKGQVVLGRGNHGWHPLKSETATLAANQPHKLRVEVDGPQFRVYVDDAEQPVLAGSDNEFGRGSIGLRAYRSTARFEDIRVNGEPVASGSDAWTTYDAAWKFDSGTIAVDEHLTAKAVLNQSNVGRKFTLEATVTVSGGGDAGLLFRVGEAADGLDNYQGYYVGITAPQSHADAAEPPTSPVTSSEPLEEVRLVPFGSTKLRVVYFPVLED
ncbi:beta-L-arabinofuranosidase domain-containing protein [Aeoliella mucimassa]|uniref:Non-reducing end beta-L-arabinofuranosidase n=1 Tax=Aeoliella mucimassa TaxID=2527972 RepID=A0A518AWF8_9BACT|nr:beta-L-arabinofuranosidase domain-containing protein [Aeoliella mucimassa]QDU59053.1 hypothetical protein Pan181_52940 [Aeoliella mucimassa]